MMDIPTFDHDWNDVSILSSEKQQLTRNVTKHIMTKWPSKLFAVQADAKTIKGEKRGYLTGIHYQASGNSSGYEVCPSKTAGCEPDCLVNWGRAQHYANIYESRLNKTVMYFEHRDMFMDMMVREIGSIARKANRLDLTPCVRPNGTSEIDFENAKGSKRIRLMDVFPDLQFYDYAKVTKRMMKFLNGQMPSNYHLTYSRSEKNEDDCIEVLKKQGNVAVVFGITKDQALPKTWKGYPVISGDEHDVRFTDPKGVVVGLHVKGEKGRNIQNTIDRMLLSGMAVAV